MAFFTMTTLAVASLALAAVGTGVAVYGQMEQAKTAKAMGRYNAQVAENQALQTEMDARESVKRKREQNSRLISTQRAGYAASGVTIDGSPLEVMADTAGILELETLDYSRQQRQQAASLRAQGAADLAMGANQARAAYIGAGASLLSGAGSAAGSAYEFNKSGAFNARNPNTMAGMAAAGAPESLAVRSGYK